jgi:hypothetical protein
MRTYFEPGLRPRRCFSNTHLEVTGEGGARVPWENLLDVGAFAALTWLLAVFCTNAFHLEEGEARSVVVHAKLAFAARQTVQARAPRTTGALELCWMSRIYEE